MHKSILTLFCILLATPGIAQGQDLNTFLQSEAGYASYELTVTPPELKIKDESFLSQMRKFLGIRKTTVERLPIGTKITIASTGYASSPFQTDSTPCITGTGHTVREGTVASNFLALGTLLEADVDGDGEPEEYIVEDRMSSRFNRRVDFWFPHTTDALTHGRREIEITVTGYGNPGDPIRQSENEIVSTTEELTTWDRVREGFSSIGKFLTTQAKPDPNRFDVDCLNGDSE